MHNSRINDEVCKEKKKERLKSQELNKEKEIGEDDEKKGLEKIQLLTDKYTARVDELVKDKEADLMEV